MLIRSVKNNWRWIVPYKVSSEVQQIILYWWGTVNSFDLFSLTCTLKDVVLKYNDCDKKRRVASPVANIEFS